MKKEKWWENRENVVYDYRVVQKEDGGLIFYGDFTESEKGQIRQELKKLAEDREFVMPQVVFEKYECEMGRKMKRVERKGSVACKTHKAGVM